MPRYELTTDEELTQNKKVALSHAMTEIHSSVTGAPPSLVHVVFLTTGPGNTFVAGEPRSEVYLQGWIRAGRDAATTRKLLSELAAAVTRLTGVGGDQVSVALREGPAHLVMIGGDYLPEPGHEARDLGMSSRT